MAGAVATCTLSHQRLRASRDYCNIGVDFIINELHSAHGSHAHEGQQVWRMLRTVDCS